MQILKKITEIITSEKSTLILLLIFSFGLASATFIENKFDTATANHIIYNALWFEIIILLLILNLLVNIFKYKLYKKSKLVGFTFHIAFILMIFGGTVTRYISWEGEMRIFEGEKSNVVYITEPVLNVTIPQIYDTIEEIIPINISSLGNNYFSSEIKTKQNGIIKISYIDYLRNVNGAIKKSSKNIIEMLIVKEFSKERVLLSDGEIFEKGDIKIAFNNDTHEAIKIKTDTSGVKLSSPYELLMTVSTSGNNTIKPDSLYSIESENVFNTQKGVIFQYKQTHTNTTKENLLNPKDEKSLDALILNIQIGKNNYEATIYGKENYIAQEQEFDFNNTRIIFAYGYKEVKLPFYIYLKEFTLYRYPGSYAPSSHVSDLILVDKKKNFQKDYKIYHNNVLDYRGYRFFQVDYVEDEKGTILSVNHDFWGTWITYLSYILLFMGLIMIFFSKQTRFRTLLKEMYKK